MHILFKVKSVRNPISLIAYALYSSQAVAHSSDFHMSFVNYM